MRDGSSWTRLKQGIGRDLQTNLAKIPVTYMAG